MLIWDMFKIFINLLQKYPIFILGNKVAWRDIMKVESMDALSTVTLQDYGQTADKPDKTDQADSAQQILDGKNISQMTKYEINELPISDKVVIEAIEKANKAISLANRRFEYSIHQKTKQIMIKVIDTDTNEIVREIPPEKILDLVANIWENMGIIVNERR